MRTTANPIHQKRIREIEQLAHTLVRDIRYAPYRPQPPVGVVLDLTPGVGHEVLRWEAPREKRNITHYLIYSPDERTLVYRAPATQFSIEGNRPSVTSALVSSWNDVSKKESIKVIALPAE